ncbi:MAG: type III pantothenate kinase [Candidatus Krumholzibacteria bacterium]|nr:type III pantothenate kinase [Candidatus Krumholzibacteria bacterium]
MGWILALDRGNHSLKIALFDSGKIVGRWNGADSPPEDLLRMIAMELTAKSTASAPGRISRQDRKRLFDSILGSVMFHSAVFSSVVPRETKKIRAALDAMHVSRVLEIGSGVEFPFEILVDKPAKVGPDRLAAAAGVSAAGEKEAVIVDAGTAITVDVLSKKGFLGGAIFPGRDLVCRALHDGTAALPLVSPGSTAVMPPGSSTREAIIAGAQWGSIGAVKELVAISRRRLSRNARVWVTGAGGASIAGRLGKGARYEGDLVFLGLHRLFETNCR